MLLLTKSEIKKAVTMEAAIQVVEKAFENYSANKADIPDRIQVEAAGKNDRVLYMPGYMEEEESLGMKMVSIFPNNPKKNLATTNAVVVLNDVETGMPNVLMEGGYLTALRTGAATGVATKYLAKKEANNLTIIGTGGQAQTQLEAMCVVRDIKKVNIFDLNRTNSENYVALMKKRLNNDKLDFQIFASPEEAVKDADIICTATTSKKPVFKNKLKKGVHINAVGSYTPQMQEIDEEVIKVMDKICVDSLTAVLEETGDLIIPLQKGIIKEADIYEEIGAISAGKLAGRSNDYEKTIFKTVGIAAQDLAISSYIYKNASDKNLGREVDLFS